MTAIFYIMWTLNFYTNSQEHFKNTGQIFFPITLFVRNRIPNDVDLSNRTGSRVRTVREITLNESAS